MVDSTTDAEVVHNIGFLNVEIQNLDLLSNEGSLQFLVRLGANP